MLDVLVIKSPVWVIMCDTLYIDTVFLSGGNEGREEIWIENFFSINHCQNPALQFKVLREILDKFSETFAEC